MVFSLITKNGLKHVPLEISAFLQFGSLMLLGIVYLVINVDKNLVVI